MRAHDGGAKKRGQINDNENIEERDDKFRVLGIFCIRVKAIAVDVFPVWRQKCHTVYNTRLVTILQASIVSRKIDTIGKDLHRTYVQVFRGALRAAA